MSNVVVVFDLGGVLVDWNPRHLYRKVFNGDDVAMEHFLQNVCTQDWNVQMDAGKPFAEGIAELASRFPEYEEYIRLYHSRWPEMVSGAIGGTVDILSEIKERGFRVYALSNWSAETFPLVKSKFEFLNWFEHIVLSGEEGVVKPSAEIYNILLRHAGCEAGQCLFIDDSEVNVKAADALGFQALRFTSSKELRRALITRGIL